MSIEAEETIEEKLRFVIPENLAKEDRGVLEFAESTLLNPTALRHHSYKTNRNINNVYEAHGLHLRKIANGLVNIVRIRDNGRGYIRVLDLGCGERYFSLNRAIIYPDMESEGEYGTIAESTDSFKNYFARSLMIAWKLLPVIPAIEFGFDNGKFGYPVADERGLFRLDFTNTEHKMQFNQNVPDGFFDLVVSTSFFGAENMGYVKPSRENLALVERVLNPVHGIFLMATADIMMSDCPEVTADYSAPVHYSEGGRFFSGYRTYLSPLVDLSGKYCPEFLWTPHIGHQNAKEKYEFSFLEPLPPGGLSRHPHYLTWLVTQ